ncbi:MAG TPA: hypothetical protein PKD46_13000 [Aggregatilineaceae bacterium]|nr:hypothetical protein [Anaerolineae bacterium]HMM29193.1 hypothetical protein [Aggregatilineaceae bacterium]
MSPNSADDPMNDLDPRLLDLLHTRLTSFVKWDVLRFFHEHPQITETAENIARSTGRDLRAVEPELVQLARHSILEMEMLTGLRVYTLSDDPAIRQLIHEFFIACDDRRFCLRAVYHVIDGLH